MTTEADIEKHLVDRVKELGGEIRKVKWQGRSFAPDRRVMLKPVNAWVELKKPDYAVTPRVRAQMREHERMRRRGERVVILSTYAEVDTFLRPVYG